MIFRPEPYAADKPIGVLIPAWGIDGIARLAYPPATRTFAVSWRQCTPAVRNQGPGNYCALRFAAASHLVARGVKLLVIACNTASAVAMPELSRRFAPLPVVGVVEAGAEAAVQASGSGHIAVLATESTVRGGAYERAIRARRGDARVYSQACSLFVALAEEGWTQGSLVEAVAREYCIPCWKRKSAKAWIAWYWGAHISRC